MQHDQSVAKASVEALSGWLPHTRGTKHNQKKPIIQSYLIAVYLAVHTQKAENRTEERGYCKRYGNENEGTLKTSMERNAPTEGNTHARLNAKCSNKIDSERLR
jgi:hypothetical protein